MLDISICSAHLSPAASMPIPIRELRPQHPSEEGLAESSCDGPVNGLLPKSHPLICAIRSSLQGFRAGHGSKDKNSGILIYDGIERPYRLCHLPSLWGGSGPFDAKRHATYWPETLSEKRARMATYSCPFRVEMAPRDPPRRTDQVINQLLGCSSTSTDSQVRFV